MVLYYYRVAYVLYLHKFVLVNNHGSYSLPLITTMNSGDGIIPENFRDAIIASLKGKLDPKDEPKRFDVPSRSLRTAIEQFYLINKMRERSK